MRTWPARRWAVATAVTVLAAVVIGVPTGVVPTPVYTRMTPVLWWNYPVWLISSAVEGLLVATYVRIGAAEATETAPRERPAPLAPSARVYCPPSRSAARSATSSWYWPSASAGPCLTSRRYSRYSRWRPSPCWSTRSCDGFVPRTSAESLREDRPPERRTPHSP